MKNKGRRRAALVTRVLVEGYRPLDDAQGWVSLSHPVLGWPSAVDAEAGSVTLYSDSGRPIGLGQFVRTAVEDGRLVRGYGGQVIDIPPGREADFGKTGKLELQWYLHLSLHEMEILDDRDKLAAGEWIIRLLVGANDGDAKRYDVHISWGRDAASADAVLAEALDHLHIEAVN